MNFRNSITNLCKAASPSEWELARHQVMALDPSYTGEALMWLDQADLREYKPVAEVVREYVALHRYRETYCDPEE